MEHALRAIHLLDEAASPTDRAERRLNDWAYAVDESERLTDGIAAHPEAAAAPPIRNEAKQREAIRQRARAIGLAIPVGKTLRVGSGKRLSTMAIGEKYLAGEDGAGVVSILLRQHAAADHGIETGLTGAVEDFDGPEGVNIMRPSAAPLPSMAFGLLAVPLSVIRAMQELRRHYQWPLTGQLASQLDKEQSRTLRLWREQVGRFEDELGQRS